MQKNPMISVLQDKYMKKNIRKIYYGGGCTFLAKPLLGLVDAVAPIGRSSGPPVGPLPGSRAANTTRGVNKGLTVGNKVGSALV